MTLVHPKPRFGFDAETGQMFDYLTSRDVPLTDAYKAPDGTWNLNLVKELILSGKPIESAHLESPSNTPHHPEPGPVPGDPILHPGSPPPTHGVSAQELEALKLSPLQLAALGITHVELTQTGLTAAQLQALALTPERAEALHLTVAQQAVLMP